MTFCEDLAAIQGAHAARREFMAALARERPQDCVPTEADAERTAVRVVELLKRQLNQTGDGFNRGEGK